MDTPGMSASAVQTRNMAATTKQADPKQIAQVGLNTMVRYLTKAVEDQSMKQKTTPTKVTSKKTPKRKQSKQKSKNPRGNVKKTPDQNDEEIEDNLSESEVYSESDTGDITNTQEGNYSNLADLDAEVTADIDPRIVNLTIEAQPLLLLALLRKIEMLESNQAILVNDNESLKQSLEFNMNKTQDLEDDVKKFQEEIANIQNEIYNANANNTKLREESIRLKQKSIKAESYSRRNNLRFEGIPNDPNETPNDCRNKIYSILKNELNIHDAEARIVIDRCHRDARYPNHNPPSMLVRFLSYRSRDEVWQRRDSLNRNQRNKLFLNQDFPPEVEKKRSFLRPYVKAAYEKGFKAVLVEDQIMVNGTKYTTDELESLPEAISPDKIAIKENNNTMLFYRSDAYLSNFHKSPFTINSIRYDCVEQYFTAEKARCFNDQVTLNKIMKADTPSEMKYHGKNTKGFNQQIWDERSSTVMLHGLRAKFQQNVKLEDKLAKTGDKLLAESSRNDRVWGTGLHINEPNSFNKDKWVGKNQLGNLLMKVRDEVVRNASR